MWSQARNTEVRKRGNIESGLRVANSEHDRWGAPHNESGSISRWAGLDNSGRLIEGELWP